MDRRDLIIVDYPSLVVAREVTEEGRKCIKELSNIIGDFMVQTNTDPVSVPKTMTKEEAMQAMHEGKKVRHYNFSPGEWMTFEGCRILTEDGCRHRQAEYWQWRTDESWNSGYSLYTE